MLLRALAVLCPWDAQKVTFWERRNIRFCADDHHIFFDVRTADDVRCARGAPQRGVATQYREIRRSGTKVTLVLNVL